MRRLRGFTLMEVMIVLAIISLLATIAIPRFTSYRSKARRSEVKTNLATVMRSEQAHFAESAGYTDNLTRLSWQPDGAPTFIFGFTSDAVPAASGINDTAELRAAGVSFRTNNMIDSFGMPLSEANLPQSLVTQQTITAGAAGNLDEDATLDQWTMDEQGNMLNVSNDVDN